MKRLNRRGQFYLIAALVIASLATGFVLTSNRATVIHNPQISDLKNEMVTESSAIINYALANQLSDSQTEGMLANLSGAYINETPDWNFYFVLGTQNNITVLAYQKNSEGVSVNSNPWTFGTEQIHEQNGLSGSSIDIKINNVPYSFEINQGGNFHFVVSSANNDQKYIISG